MAQDQECVAKNNNVQFSSHVQREELRSFGDFDPTQAQSVPESSRAYSVAEGESSVPRSAEKPSAADSIFDHSNEVAQADVSRTCENEPVTTSVEPQPFIDFSNNAANRTQVSTNLGPDEETKSSLAAGFSTFSMELSYTR